MPEATRAEDGRGAAPARCASPSGSTVPRPPSASSTTSTCATCAAWWRRPTIRWWRATRRRASWPPSSRRRSSPSRRKSSQLWLADVESAARRRSGRARPASCRRSRRRPGVPFPAALGDQARRGSPTPSLTPDDPADRWIAVLEAAAFSPVRTHVQPSGVARRGQRRSARHRRAAGALAPAGGGAVRGRGAGQGADAQAVARAAAQEGSGQRRARTWPVTRVRRVGRIVRSRPKTGDATPAVAARRDAGRRGRAPAVEAETPAVEADASAGRGRDASGRGGDAGRRGRDSRRSSRSPSRRGRPGGRGGAPAVEAERRPSRRRRRRAGGPGRAGLRRRRTPSPPRPATHEVEPAAVADTVTADAAGSEADATAGLAADEAELPTFAE